MMPVSSATESKFYGFQDGRWLGRNCDLAASTSRCGLAGMDADVAAAAEDRAVRPCTTSIFIGP